MAICVAKMQMRPKDFWTLTFGEFWPLYNGVMGITFRPMNEDDLEAMNDEWIGVEDGDSRGNSSPANG